MPIKPAFQVSFLKYLFIRMLARWVPDYLTQALHPVDHSTRNSDWVLLKQNDPYNFLKQSPKSRIIWILQSIIFP